MGNMNYLVLGTNPDDPPEYDEEGCEPEFDGDGAFDDEPDYDNWEDDDDGE